MVNHKRLELLKHPVVGSLIHYKWIKFGLFTYFINLLTYTFYLGLLTTFAVTAPDPQSNQCNLSKYDYYNLTDEEFCPAEVGGIKIIIISALVLLLAFIRLGVELVQLGKQRLRYLADWINGAEIVQYSCTVVFVWVFHNQCFCVLQWQWQVGVVSVFLGWIVMILFVSKLPWVGIYVLILQRISWTFAKMTGLSLFLVVSFAITFHMIFFDIDVIRSPFSDIPRSLLKTMTMSTGELDYDAIFRLDPSGGSDDSAEIKYPPTSYLVWITFIVFMPLILTNMLTSLAVDDTTKVQEEAHLRKLALQVDQILSMQELLRVFGCCLQKIKWKYCKHFRVIYPNKHTKGLNLDEMSGYKKTESKSETKSWLKSWIKFKLWEGERYDKSEVIRAVLHPQKTEFEDHVEKEIQDIKNTLSDLQSDLDRKVDQMTHTLANIQGLVAHLAEREGVRQMDIV